MMKTLHVYLLVVPLFLGACGSDVEVPAEQAADADKTAVTKGKPTQNFDGTVAKPGAPFSISYKIIGTPIVGSPVAVELRVSSRRGAEVVQLDYSIPDGTSMMFHDAQPSSIQLEFGVNDAWADQRVTIIPQREGRLYLNVSASIASDGGRSSTTIAIPIQVGQGGRELEVQGELAIDEDGELIRVLTSE